ncbi:flagellar basal body-associated FliL family protein [Roseixanthobacter glucoisosaccharinicivorans]|uniref:flagellar basal body-associated FliL family protein n=1 Tax=Roseixanthobacter glucoisosaccharinicivorans TaxID=3119923 RepID=UPI003729B3C7
MAAAPAKKAAPEAGAAPAKKGGGMILALLILTVLGVVMGGGLGYQLAGTVEKVVAAKPPAEPEKKPEPLAYTGNLSSQALKPVVVNLAAPSGTFARLESTIIFKTGALANPQLTASEIREDIMAFMRTLSLSQLEGPSALQHLREDLNERAGIRSEGKVSELVLETLVVQ